MSLIEEALRRQEKEQAESNLSSDASAPAPSQPVEAAQPVAVATDPEKRPPSTKKLPPRIVAPVAPAIASQVFKASAVIAHPIHPDLDRQRSLTMTMLAGIGVLVLLVLAGVVFLRMARATPRVDPPVAISAKVPLVAQNPAPLVPVVVPVPAPAPPVVLPTPAPASLVLPPTSSVPMACIANPVSSVIVAATVATGREVIVDSVAVALTPPAPPVVVWPEIVIKGMLFSGGKTLVLLGDGLTLEIGALTPTGVRLLEAGPGWVRMSYKGQVRTYRRNGKAFLVDTDAGTEFVPQKN